MPSARNPFVLLLLALTASSGAQTPALSTPSTVPPVECDLLFAGGRVVDGTGAPWFRGDVCVKGDRIAAVGALTGAAATRRVDATRLVIAPGFIDMMGQSEYRILVDGRAASKITQGITTEITGEGSSIAPIDARLLAAGKPTYEHYGYTPMFTTIDGYFKELVKRGSAVNVGTFVGAGGLRSLVIGEVDRAATAAELERMKAHVAQAMEEGALGLSTSLIYVPDHFASTDEIIALAKVAASYGGSYITHQRDEGDDNGGGLDASMDEVMRIAREANIPAEVYHLKASGKRNWGRMKDLLERIERARAEGLDVSADQYPWAASSNNLDASLPFWVREGGAEPMVARLKDPAQRARARTDFLKMPENADWPAGAARILVTAVLNPALKSLEGQTIEQIAAAATKDPIDTIMDIVADDKGNTARVSFSMSEDDVRTALRSPLVSFCTDSGASAEDGIFSKQKSHPRAWGSASRILGYYVRDQKVLSLEEAIRKMTSLPAARMRLTDRGIVRAGMAADLVAFDPDTVDSRATYADPLHYSVGMPYVAVNGALVVDGGVITAARPGRALRGPGYKAK